MGFSGGLQGLLWEERARQMGRGLAEAAPTLQSQTSGQFRSSSDFGTWQLGDCCWGILLLTGTLLPLVQPQPRHIAGGSQRDPMEMDGDQMPSMGKPNPASQSKAGPGPAPSGDF